MESADYTSFYPIVLMSRRPLHCDPDALLPALCRRLGRVAIGASPGPEFAHFFLEDYPAELRDGSVPAQLVLTLPKPQDASTVADLEAARQQSWDDSAAVQILPECHRRLIFSTLMASPLTFELRREILLQGLLAVLETHEIDLIHWEPTQQLLSRTALLEHYADEETRRNPTFGFLNVRLFQVENSDGDCLMDTLGLGALGLTDFQVVFQEPEPNTMAGFLRNLGSYVLEKGDVIDDGHTVTGPDGSRWECARLASFAPPARDVLHLDRVSAEV